MKPDTGREALVVVALIAAATVPFLPSLAAGFVMDDHVEVERNLNVTGAWNWHRALMSDASAGAGRRSSGLYRPVLTLAYRLIAMPAGVRPVSYHMASLLVSAAAVALGYLALRVAGASVASAGIGMGLFAVHPLHVDVISPASGLKDLLPVVLGVGSLLAWLRHRRQWGWQVDGGEGLPHIRRAAWLALSCFLLLLSLLSKESTAVLPVVFVVADLLGLSGTCWEAEGRAETSARLHYWASYLPVAVTIALAAGLRAAATGGLYHAGVIPPVDNPLVEQPWLLARLTALRVLARYALLFVWPGRISNDYSADSVPVAGGALEAEVLLGGLLLLAALIAPALLALRGRRVESFGLVAFLAGYAVIGNLGPLFGSIMAPRFFYFPSWGLCVALGAALAAAASGSPLRRRVVFGLTLGTCAALAVRSWARCADWRDDASLYASAVAVAPGNAKMLSNLASVRIAQGRLAEGEALCRKSVSIRPERSHPYTLLASVLETRGKTDEAIRVLETAVAQPNPLAQARTFLARLLIEEGRLDEAEGQIHAALVSPDRMFDNEAVALWLRGRVRIARERFEESLPDLDRALELLPGDPRVLHERGIARFSLGRSREGLADLDAAVAAARPDDPVALYDAGVAHLRAGEPARASDLLGRFIERDPGSEQGWLNLGLALAASGRRDEARRALERALAAAPEDPAAHLALADLLDAAGSLPTARAEYAFFLRNAPPGDRDRPRVLRRFPDLAPSR